MPNTRKLNNCYFQILIKNSFLFILNSDNQYLVLNKQLEILYKTHILSCVNKTKYQ